MVRKPASLVRTASHPNERQAMFNPNAANAIAASSQDTGDLHKDQEVRPDANEGLVEEEEGEEALHHVPSDDRKPIWAARNELTERCFWKTIDELPTTKERPWQQRLAQGAGKMDDSQAPGRRWNANDSEFSYLNGAQADLCVKRDALAEVLKHHACELLYDPGTDSAKGEPILAKRIIDYTHEERKLLRRCYKSHHKCIDRLAARQKSARKAEEQETLRFPQATSSNARKYAKPFCDFLTENPTVFHAVSALKEQMQEAGWTELSERDDWKIDPSGRYFVERNGSSLVSFVVGAEYKPGNGAAIIAGHIDALTAKLKPVSKVPNKAGYLQLGVAPYAGGMGNTWWDRDLGIAGRVLVKEGGKIVTKLVNLNWPIARIPTLAPHFGAAAQGPFNQETQMTPIIGLDDDPSHDEHSTTAQEFAKPSSSDCYVFTNTQPPALVNAIASQLDLPASEHSKILNWELELYDVQPATLGGLNREFIYAGRIDDKLCSWAAQQALLESSAHDTSHSSLIKTVALFDDEEIGSQLRQGARGNLLSSVLERAVGSLANTSNAASTPVPSDQFGRFYANSFLVSADVTHAVNPNFLPAYLPNHSPHLNTGLVVSADSNGHMTTDAVSTTILQRCAETVGAKLQVFQIRNDSRSGGTVGPMLSSALGVRAVDAGLPQLSMHSIRATTGSLDPGLGVLAFVGFLSGFEGVDAEMR
ncbi:hypothetical protein MBLNU230_g0514t1 [Neophaeotheca triangularis]